MKTLAPGLCLALLLQLPLPANGQDLAWPSPEQVAQVRERRATIPATNLVSQVGWYTPQELVRGAAQPEQLPVRAAHALTIKQSALLQATAYADGQKSYALIIWRNGAVELEKYWRGFNPESRFETASMHKSVLALAIGAAVAEGNIGSVEDRLSRYLPEMAGTRRGELPLRAFMEMSSGIESPPYSGGDDSPYWQYALGNNLDEAVAHWPDSCVPRTEFCYANANSHYLGRAIEAATRMRYADWLSRKLWKPIGAADARLWLDREGGSPRFSCCLIANARDWLRVGRLFLDKGKAQGRRVIPAKWIAAMTAPSPANANYGWQLWLGSPHVAKRVYSKNIRVAVPAAQAFARDDVIYFDGSGAQRVYIIPSEKLVIVRIGQASFDWDDSLLPNIIIAGLK